MEPWEQILDVDDSDLLPPNPLRRCNNHRSTTTTAAAATVITDIFHSETLDTSPSSSQTIKSQSTLQSRTIPGPAGIVQAAKLRKTHDLANRVGREEHPMATQEYIRKVIEDPQEDEDFKLNPWFSAIEFVYNDDSSASNAPLGKINKCQKNGKLHQVVAVIKSCTSNELGDMTVTLKDPTGSVSGTIHHKVLTEGDFRKGICVGSVVILNNVSVFSPSRSAHYLNITKTNLVKVFYKDGGSSQIQKLQRTMDATLHSVSSQGSRRARPMLDFGSSQKQTCYGTIDATPHSDSGQATPTLDGRSSQKQTFHGTIDATPLSDLSSQDSGRGVPVLGSAFFLGRGTEGITNRLKRANTNNEKENINCSKRSNKDTNMMIAREKETEKEADVIEKGEIVGQLTEGCINAFNETTASGGGWTDEQLNELSFWDDI